MSYPSITLPRSQPPPQKNYKKEKNLIGVWALPNGYSKMEIYCHRIILFPPRFHEQKKPKMKYINSKTFQITVNHFGKKIKSLLEILPDNRLKMTDIVHKSQFFLKPVYIAKNNNCTMKRTIVLISIIILTILVTVFIIWLILRMKKKSIL